MKTTREGSPHHDDHKGGMAPSRRPQGREAPAARIFRKGSHWCDSVHSGPSERQTCPGLFTQCIAFRLRLTLTLSLSLSIFVLLVFRPWRPLYSGMGSHTNSAEVIPFAGQLW